MVQSHCVCVAAGQCVVPAAVAGSINSTLLSLYLCTSWVVVCRCCRLRLWESSVAWCWPMPVGRVLDSGNGLSVHYLWYAWKCSAFECVFETLQHSQCSACFWGRVTLGGGRRWHCWVGRWYVAKRCQIQVWFVLTACGNITRCEYKPQLYLALFDHSLWCKFWVGVVSASLAGRGGRRGLDMGTLSSLPGKLPIDSPIVIIGLSLTVFAVLKLVTNGQMELV